MFSIIVLLGLLVLSLLAAVTFGSVEIPIGDVYRIITDKRIQIGSALLRAGNIAPAIGKKVVSAFHAIAQLLQRSKNGLVSFFLCQPAGRCKTDDVSLM